MILYLDVAKRPRKCKGDRKHSIPSGATCLVQKIPSVQTARGFTMYTDQSFCLDCAARIAEDLRAAFLKLDEDLRKVKV